MRHVIWDWNGTLVDDLAVVVDAVNLSLAGIGESPIDADRYRDHYTRPVRRFYESLLGRGVSDSEWQAIDRTFHDAYVDAVHSVKLTHDALRAIAAVDAEGATQSVLSMWWHDDLVAEVRRRELDGVMIRVDGNTSDAGATKARLLEQHVSNLGGERRPILIGDATDDAYAAFEVGIPVVLYDGGSHHRHVLESFDVPVATSLTKAVRMGLSI